MYEWLKALHVIAVISWMAGLLYMPRLFVYHAEAPVGSPQSDVFKIMERRLFRGIMTPAMLLTWAFGITVAIEGGWFSAGWLHGKLALVVGLTAFHVFLGRQRLAFAADRNRHTSKFYRMINEIPALFMIGIVILVIVKPF